MLAIDFGTDDGVVIAGRKRLLGSAGKLRLSGVGSHLRDIFVYSGPDQIVEIGK